jgi:uncharacterized protein (DUF58 family)
MSDAPPTPPVAAPTRPRRRWADYFRASALEIPPDMANKDLGQYLLYEGLLSRFFWGLVFHRLTRAGRWFLFLTFALFLIGGISLEIQAYIPFVYAAALWLVAITLTFFLTPKARISVAHAERIRVGQRLTVEVSVTQTGKRAGHEYNVAPIRLPPPVDAVEPWGVPVGTLLPGETRRVRLHLLCRKRGQLTLKGYRVETDFPLGLLNAYRNFKDARTLLVYPDYEPLARLDLPTGRRFQPGGIALASRLGDSFEYLGNREFREGDNVRDIDWRATARMAGYPIVREFREEFFQRVGVVLDTYVPANLGEKPKAARRAAFERAVGLAAAVGDYMAGQEYVVDLFAAGPNLYHLTAGRSLAYLEQILDILAVVRESETEPLEAVAPEIQEYVDRLTSVVCVFLTWDETRAAFVNNLRRGGAGVRAFVVADDAPDAPGDVTVLDSAAFKRGINTL